MLDTTGQVEAPHADLSLARAAAVDPAAADRLLGLVQPRVLQVVRMAVAGNQEARDLAQQAMLAVLEGLGGYRGDGPIESWAGQVTYRVVMRQLKRQRTWERSLAVVDEDAAPSPGPSPERIAARAGAWELLGRRMERIPPKRRVPLLLHLAQGRTVAEIAVTTGASENTVKDRLRTGFRELRAILDRDPDLKRAMKELAG